MLSYKTDGKAVANGTWDQALTAYFRRGKWISFLCCLSVFNFFSCCTIQRIGKRESHISDVHTHKGQPPPNGTRLLLAEIERQILLVLIELAEMLTLLRVHDSEHPSNRFADGVTR